MARVHTEKEKAQKKSSKPTAKSQGRKVKTKPKHDGQLREQIASLGGTSQDVELLKDVQSDDQLEIGDQEYDVRVLRSFFKFSMLIIYSSLC